MVRVLRKLITPERLYLVALGMSGLAALLSVFLVPAERGQLAASLAGATLGSAIGGISVDTFLMSRPKGWVWGRGESWVAAIAGGCVLLSLIVAALVIALAGIGSYLVAIGAAGCLTVFNVCSSLALRISKFHFVYGVRSGAGFLVLVGYGLFYVDGRVSGLDWALAYLFAQACAALVLGLAVLRWARQRRPADRLLLDTPDTDRRSDILGMTKVHVGVSAQMVTSRLDQILLARFAGAAPLGVYALAVAALEFAQAGAVVRSQRILTTRDAQGSAPIPPGGPVVAMTLPIAVCSVLALAGLGLLRPQYHGAWVLGLLLLPGAVAAALGKTWSAALLIRKGEGAASLVSVISAAVAVPMYFLLIPWFGTIGAPIAMSCAYAVYAFGANRSLRTPRVLAPAKGGADVPDDSADPPEQPGGAVNEVDLSIVVLAWEDIDETQKCVRSLPRDAELIVVDNGSAADIRVGIEKLCAEVGARYVQTGANLGYARGMNAGAAKATGSNLILANNDVIVHPGAVEALVASLDDPGVGLAFPRVVDVEGNEETAAGRFLTVPVGLGHATGLSMLAPRLRIVAEPEQADWLTGPFVAMRRTTFDAVGGVDESSEFYAEDLRLCWAVRRNRMRIAYVPDAVIEHLGDASSQRRWTSEEISRRQTREFIRAARQLGGPGAGLASAAYVAGAVWRAGLARDPVRRAIARGAIEGMRAG